MSVTVGDLEVLLESVLSLVKVAVLDRDGSAVIDSLGLLETDSEKVDVAVAEVVPVSSGDTVSLKETDSEVVIVLVVEEVADIDFVGVISESEVLRVDE